MGFGNSFMGMAQTPPWQPPHSPWAQSTSLRNQVVRQFPGGPVAETLCSQLRVLGFHPSSGNQSPQTTSKSLHITAKDPTRRILNED